MVGAVQAVGIPGMEGVPVENVVVAEPALPAPSVARALRTKVSEGRSANGKASDQSVVPVAGNRTSTGESNPSPSQ